MYRNGSWYGVDSAEDYVLPIASKDILGGIRIGETLTIDEDGVLDVVDSGDDCECDNVGHFDRTTGTPTTGEIFNSYSGDIINKATGSYSHAEGSYSTASGTYSHAENLYTTASGNYSHAEGNYTFATGDGAHSEGKSTRAEGECSHVEGEMSKATGSYAHAEGFDTTAEGRYAHAEGENTKAAYGSHAEGHETVAGDLEKNARYAHAEGDNTEAIGETAHSEGSHTHATGDYSHAEGYYTTASGLDSHSEGNNTTASGNYSHAEGSSTTASGKYSHSEGSQSEATGEVAHAEGNQTHANGDYSHAEGNYTFATGNYSHAENSNTTASGSESHAEGYSTTASGNRSHTEGMSTTASSDEAHAEGIGTTASGNYSHAEGSYTNATKDSAHSEGYGGRKITDAIPGFSSSTSKDEIVAAWGTTTSDGFTLASGMGSHAEGYHTLALDTSAHAEGDATHALGKGSHSEGHTTKAVADDSHAEGDQTVTKGQASHAEGFKSTTLGHYAHAEGCNTTADGYNHSEGVSSYTLLEALPSYNVWGTPPETIIEAWNTKNFTFAKGNGSHAEGQDTLAIGQASHAEGFRTRATSLSAHSEGRNTKAEGYYSHAEGMSSVASGDYSHAQGNYTIANGDSQFTLGKFNIPDNNEKYAVIIGGGTGESNRKNVFTIDWNGNIEAGVRDANGNITYGTINGVDITQIEGGEGGGSSPYELPIASSDTLGGIKIGNGLEKLDDGTVNVISGDNKKYYEGKGIEFALEDQFSIPGGYQEVEYIESQGTEVFNTQYVNKANTRIVIDAIMRDNRKSWQTLFGGRSATTSDNFHVMMSQYGMGGEYTYAALWKDTRVLIDFSKDALLISQVETGIVRDPILINSNGINGQVPIYLFALNSNGSADARSNARLYSMKIYEDDILVRYFVPVQNLSNNAYGIFDLVTQTYIAPMYAAIQIHGEATQSFTEAKETINVKYGAGLEVNKSGELDLKIKIVPCTQEQYDALEVKDPNTLYLIGD